MFTELKPEKPLIMDARRDEIVWETVVDDTYQVVEDMMARGYGEFDGTVARVLEVGGNYQVYQIKNVATKWGNTAWNMNNVTN